MVEYLQAYNKDDYPLLVKYVKLTKVYRNENCITV